MRKRLFGLTCLVCSLIMLTASNVIAAPPPEPQLDPLEGFGLVTFFDISGDGVADADNPLLPNAPFFDVSSNDGYTCSVSENTSCNLWVEAGRQFVKIKDNRSNGIGDAGIARHFHAAPGQHYAATATVSLIDADLPDGSNLWARLTVVGSSLGGAQANPECNSLVQLSKDGIDRPSDPDPVVEVLEVPGCRLASGTQKVFVKVRLKSTSLLSGGTMVIHEVTFHRCLDSGCTAPSV